MRLWVIPILCILVGIIAFIVSYFGSESRDFDAEYRSLHQEMEERCGPTETQCRSHYQKKMHEVFAAAEKAGRPLQVVQ